MTVTSKVTVTCYLMLMKKIYNILLAFVIAMLGASNIYGAAFAVSDSPAQIAEHVRSSLVQAQLDLTSDPTSAAAASRSEGVTHLLKGLDSYGSYFSHPGWKAVAEAH